MSIFRMNYLAAALAVGTMVLAAPGVALAKKPGGSSGPKQTVSTRDHRPAPKVTTRDHRPRPKVTDHREGAKRVPARKLWPRPAPKGGVKVTSKPRP